MKQIKTVWAYLVTVAAVVIGFSLLSPQSASAATYNINTTADENSDPGAGCSLYEALTALTNNIAYGGCSAPDQNTGSNTIILPPGAYTASLDDSYYYYPVDGITPVPLTIRGASDGSTTIVGNNGWGRVNLSVSSGVPVFAMVTVQDLSFSCEAGNYETGLTINRASAVTLQRVNIHNEGCSGSSSSLAVYASPNVNVSDINLTGGAYLGLEGNINLAANNLNITGGGYLRLDGNDGATLGNLLIDGSTGDGIYVGGINEGVNAQPDYMTSYMNYATTLNNLTVRNSASYGINHNVADKLYINNANIHDNTAGGARNNEILPSPSYPATTLYFNNSYIHHNGNSNANGGGIDNENGHVVITNTTIADNMANTGGGIFTYNGVKNIASGTANTYIEMTNAIIFDNTANYAGGIALQDVTAAPLASTYLWSNSTIAGNHTTATDYPSSAFDIYEDTDNPDTIVRPTLINMLLDNSDGPAQCVTTGTHLFDAASSHNLTTDSSCGPSFTVKSSADIKLATSLADNAGPTAIGYNNEIAGLPVLAILTGSAAQDTGTNQGCPSTDARGFGRPAGPSCDIGAYELPVVPTAVPGVPDTGFASLSARPSLIIGGLLIGGVGTYGLLVRHRRFVS